jgi:hypothetical protein
MIRYENDNVYTLRIGYCELGSMVRISVLVDIKARRIMAKGSCFWRALGVRGFGYERWRGGVV